MKKTLALAVVAACLGALVSSARINIVGGGYAKAAVPYLASLRRGNNDSPSSLACGAVLIAPRFLLTTVDCVTTGAKTVTIGGLKNSGLDGENNWVVKSYQHPKYDPKSLAYDLAVLELNRRSNLTPVALDWKGDLTTTGVQVTVRGFGRVGYGYLFQPSPVLKEIRYPIWPTPDCEAKIGYKLDSSILCAGDNTTSNQVCYGDSGSPVIVESDGHDVLVGISCAVYVCGMTREPAQFARIYSSRDFIEPFLTAERNEDPAFTEEPRPTRPPPPE